MDLFQVLFVAVGLSLDAFAVALAVGLSLAMIRVQVLYPSVIIGAVTFLLTYVGFRRGTRLHFRYGKKLEIIGGIVLVLVGMQIVFKHL